MRHPRMYSRLEMVEHYPPRAFGRNRGDRTRQSSPRVGVSIVILPKVRLSHSRERLAHRRRAAHYLELSPDSELPVEQLVHDRCDVGARD